ncbi:MAG: hypothetical protein ACPGRX_04180, partial [Bdellovibrionales bacterium]
LSELEAATMKMVAQGLTNEDIAKRLIESHSDHERIKTVLKNRQLIAGGETNSVFVAEAIKNASCQITGEDFQAMSYKSAMTFAAVQIYQGQWSAPSTQIEFVRPSL